MNFLLAFSAAIAVAVANFSLMNQNEKCFEGQVIPISTESDHFLGPLISHFDIYTIAALPLHQLASNANFILAIMNAKVQNSINLSHLPNRHWALVQSPSPNLIQNLSLNLNPRVCGWNCVCDTQLTKPFKNICSGCLCAPGKSWLAKSFSQLINTEPLTFDLAKNLCFVLHFPSGEFRLCQNRFY